MKVSIKNISEVTGFSPATVSNALNHKKGVNAQTSEKVRKAAEELGYRLEEKIKKIRFVIYRRNGLIIDDSSFHPAVIEGVERQAKRMGYETMFCHIDAEEPKYQIQIKDILSDTESAIVLMGTEMQEEDFELFVPAIDRMVVLDGWSDRYFFDSVLISNTDSAFKAVDYLVGKGHKEIGYLRGDFRIQAFRYREIGYRRAHEKHGLSVYPQFTVDVGTRIETAYDKMRQYLKKAERVPTAFFADNDTIAIGAIRALKEHGYDIPGEVSVIGFDNITFSSVCEPPLTTIDVYKREMGEMSVRELMRLLEDPKKLKMKIQVCTGFVERASVRNIQ